MRRRKIILITKKIRLKPTYEQEILFYKSAGVARWAYNYYLAENDRVYKEYISNGYIGVKFITEGEVRKYINNVLKPTTHTWLNEVGSNVMKQGVKDASDAYKRYFKGISNRPKFKSKHKSKLSFYVNYESLTKKQGGFRGEKIGYVKTCEDLPSIPKGTKYANPRISYDGVYWYLTVGYEVGTKNIVLEDVSLGIDLGVKDLAICSNGKVYKNINKTKKVKQLKKKLKREQRKLSRKIENNIKEYKNNRVPVYERTLRDCANIQKQKQKVNHIYKKLNNIRTNYLHQVTTEIVKTKPSQIVMEDLNVKGMLKNKHLAKVIQEQSFYKFIRQIKYKTEMYGIKFVQVDRFYPSSKTCSRCGYVKCDLKLSDRIYVCDCCGLVIDRDYNASINLANYIPV